MKYDLSLIIACYNEEPILEQSIQEIIDILDISRFSYEIIFVDDCSEDSTRQIIDTIIKRYKNKRFRKLFHEKNTGRGGAVTDGFRMAEGKVAGFIDIDLEVHARYIPSFVMAIKNGYDVAVAHRVYTFQLRYMNRYILTKGYNWLVRHFLRIPLRDTEAGYKFFNRKKLLPIINSMEDKGWFWDTEFVARAYFHRLKIKETPCLFLKRYDKLSTVNSVLDTLDYLRKLLMFRRKLNDLNWIKRDINLAKPLKGIGRREYTKREIPLVYWHPIIYEIIMRFLYKKEYRKRLETISQEIGDLSVLDLCCGTCGIYRYLKTKDYLGLDINERFIRFAKASGIKVKYTDIENDDWPKDRDCIIIIGSLYQFIPQHEDIIKKAFHSARKKVIICEPILNWTSSNNKIVSFIAKKVQKGGEKQFQARFTERTLLKVYKKYKTKKIIPLGKDLLAVFEK
ncbi:glycosyltransferase [candidate division WOR-3 bacterium]|nr:glycosyltransferase [candidate division WOR-3 bacterium]